MASYEDIRAYFDESELLQRVARLAARVPIVSGFTLDIDPLWSRLYDIENDLEDQLDARLPLGDPELALYGYGLLATSSDMPPLLFQPPYRSYRRRDLHATVSEWKDLTENFRENTGRQRLPVVLTVVHRPLRAARPGEPLENDDTSLLLQLVRATRESGVAVRIEERPRARLALASGDEIAIGKTNSGTLGGVLEDKANGISFGVTCSHVAQQNDHVYDLAGNHIGVCTADTTRLPLPTTLVCDPINLALPNPIPSNGPDVNMLDCALIRMTAAVTRPTISGVALSLSPGQSVVLTGAATGRTHHWLGSLCLSYGFSHGGQNFCFRDAIELVPQPSGVLGRTIVPTQGDSGSWILTDDLPPEWAGVFFGEDGKRGFAIRAKWVHAWAEQTTGLTLTP